MEQQLIRGVGVTSSRIGLGTWSIGGWMWGGSDDAEAVKTIRTALDLGITLIDTAPAYGFGRSEELVGQAIAEQGGRERVLIATKAGLGWHAGAVYRDASAVRIRTEIEDSLRRLGTSYIDMYQVHWPDPLVPVEETAAQLGRLFERGTIRAIGVSNFSPEQIETFRGVAPLHVVQSPYNVFERAIETDVLPYARQHGLTVLAYGALCRGLLSGRMRRTTRFLGDVGRTPPGPARADRRRARLAPGRRDTCDDRSPPGRARPRSRRPRVHGSAGARGGRSRPGPSSVMSRRRFGKALATAVVVAACMLALRVGVGTAQEGVVIEGRVLWVAGQTMVVAPYTSGVAPIRIDLSQASQDEYMRLTTGDSVTVMGIIPYEGDRVVATSIRDRS